MTNDDRYIDRYIMGRSMWDKESVPAATEYTRIAEVEWDDESYEFNLTAVYRHEDGRLFVASDSGCSCPIPFDDTRESDLTPITRLQDWYDYIAPYLEHEFYVWSPTEPGRKKRADDPRVVDQVASVIKVIEANL